MEGVEPIEEVEVEFWRMDERRRRSFVKGSSGRTRLFSYWRGIVDVENFLVLYGGSIRTEGNTTKSQTTTVIAANKSFIILGFLPL